MISLNICSSTCCTVKPSKNQIHNYKEIELDDGGEKVWVHQKVDGVLPIILKNLWCERKKVKREMKMVDKTTVEGSGVYELMDAKQKALKISMNRSAHNIF